MLQDVIRRKYEACPATGDGRSRAHGLAGQHSARLPRSAGRALELSLSFPPRRAGSPQQAHQGDRRDAACATAIGGSTCCCVAKAGQSTVKRVCRLYREQGLQLRNKSPKRRVKAKLREGPLRRRPKSTRCGRWTSSMINCSMAARFAPSPWSTSSLESRRRSKCGRAGAAATSSPCSITRAGEVGYPRTIRLDNGPEFISKELDLWAFMHGVTLDFSRPGKPTDNAFVESVNGKFRGECLNTNWFLSLDEAQRKCEAWRRDYNEVRPHSAIGNQVPVALHRTAGKPGRPAAR